MKLQFFIALAIISLASCDHDNLPRRAVAYDQKFTPVVPLIQTTIHGKPIVETFTAKVIGITDGDTIKVLTADNQQIKVRLEAIDCPESKQPFGNKAKQAMSELVFGNSVTVMKTGSDRYGRTLAFVVVDGANVSELMIQNGFAWHYVDYSDSVELARLEVEARQAKRGLWQDATPIPPWEWRKKKQP